MLHQTDHNNNAASHPETGLTRQQQSEGMRYTFMAVSFGAIMFMLLAGSALGALFIKKMGGSDFQAMLPGSIMILAGFLRLPASIKVAPRNGKAFMLRCWWFGVVLIVVALISTVFLSPGKTMVAVFLILLGLAVSIGSMGSAFWFPMLHDLVPVHRRGRFFGKLRAVWSSTSLCFILISGVFLGKDPALWQFQIVFAVATVIFALRILFVMKIPAGNSLAGELDYDHWKHYVMGLLREKPLLIFMGYYCLLGFCMGFLSQPLVLYMKYRGLPANNNVFIYSFKVVGMIISFLVAGSLVDRLGTKRIFLSAHLILCATCFSVVGIGMLPNKLVVFLLPVAMVISGGTAAASGVACTAQLFHLAPNRGRAFYLNLAMIIISAGSAVSPLFVGWLLGRTGPQWAFEVVGLKLDIFQATFVFAAVGMLAVIILLYFVQNVQPGANRRTGE